MRAPSRASPLLQRPAPTTDQCVGAGLPANTMAAATVNHGWKLASRSGPFAGKPAPTTACTHHRSVCRSGFTREYDGGWDSESRVEIGQQARPFRGQARSYNGLRTTNQYVGAGLPANTMAAATVNRGWTLASRSSLFAGNPASTKKPPLGAAFSLRLSSAYSCGPAALMASETSNFLKFSMNSLARPLAASS